MQMFKTSPVCRSLQVFDVLKPACPAMPHAKASARVAYRAPSAPPNGGTDFAPLLRRPTDLAQSGAAPR